MSVGAADVLAKAGSKRSSAKCASAFSEAEREFVGEELSRFEVTLPEVVIEGVRHRRVVSGSGEYMTAARLVSVLRHRYRAVGTNGQSECPLQLRAGLVERFFTPWRRAWVCGR